MDENIEFLFGGAELDIGFELNGIDGGEQRIKQLMHGNGLAIFEPRAKIFALEHAGKTVVAAKADDVVAGKLVEPLGVVTDFGFLRIEELENLREIGFGVGVHFFARERRASFGAARGIADHGGKIADEKDRGVAEVLKMFEFAKDDGVAEMDVGRGGVHTEIDAQRRASLQRLFELRFQLRLGNDFGGAFFEVGELFFDGFEFGF